MAPSAQEQETHTVNIVVHNEDTGGKPIDLKGQTTDTVQSFIDQLYQALRTTHKNDDRLRCGQVNVFSFANLTIADFQRQQCAGHEWVFAGATGGALCFLSR